MRTSFIAAAMLIAGTAASGAGAVVHFATSPFNGSDTLFDLTNGAIAASGLGVSGDYLGGGSGAAENNMTAATPKQWMGPMSKMLTNGSCSTASVTYPDTGAAVAQTHASGQVIALDALSIFSSTFSGASASCDAQSTDGTDTTHGLAATTTISGTVSGNPVSVTFHNWTDMLALLYGGLDKSAATKVTDCDSPARQLLVSQWNNAFQGGQAGGSCTSNPSSACTTAKFPSCPIAAPGACSGGLNNNTTVGNALWHAFRRDDNSGTSDVFSSLIGITTIYAQPGAGAISSIASGKLASSSGAAVSYSVSASKLNGFGISPFCNAMNWDTTSVNGSTCAQGQYHQFVGPGGIPEPKAGLCPSSTATTPVTCSNVGSACADGSGTCVQDGYHRRPPPGVWGDTTWENGTANIGADVLPTSYQDNDPIRRPCLGAASVVGQNHPAEEICNLDGQLGLVLPVPPVDWITDPNGVIKQATAFPTAKCSGFASGGFVFVHKCAPTTVPSNEACPDGSKPGAACNWMVTQFPYTAGHDACENDPKGWPLPDVPVRDGRIFNLIVDNTSTSTPQAVPYAIPGTSVSLNFFGAFSRIHQQYPLWDSSVSATPPVLPGTNPTNQVQQGCQMTDATDQIGCLTQADPCSVGYAGFGGNSWFQHEGLSLAIGGENAMELAGLNATGGTIGGIYPTIADIQAAGTSGSYPAWRKLYYNSSKGFDAVDGVTDLDESNGGSSVNDTASSELALGQYEAVTANAENLASTYGFFALGPLAATDTLGSDTADQPFCEDYNEQNLCAASANVNGCAFNAHTLAPASNPDIHTLGLNAANFGSIPTTSTTCGDGHKDPFEDCDPGTGPFTSCSNTCRFVLQ